MEDRCHTFLLLLVNSGAWVRSSAFQQKQFEHLLQNHEWDHSFGPKAQTTRIAYARSIHYKETWRFITQLRMHHARGRGSTQPILSHLQGTDISYRFNYTRELRAGPKMYVNSHRCGLVENCLCLSDLRSVPDKLSSREGRNLVSMRWFLQLQGTASSSQVIVLGLGSAQEMWAPA
jgi:hypothetical protein